ncbi:TetR/AcrR family transcriptional regulator [Mycobacterium sp. Y57]|uniref:TetR/AcrR family transcriptional regulator n=1 Tax=Mycolicibacterium xanthum TaxID=2796469 RepID=UPI001C863210|nr:TetR/AcrR family transcriptional regulator [Mycolicibacterium xanthum]MBX7431278.1 TetR/AcrR family transcriptional regulator [Mycolicibacterium xanthum]
MTATDKAPPRRKYNSTRRRQNAEQTRREILGTARANFVQHGWHGAGMREIARDAGVSVETVYSNFPSKAALFKEVLNILVVGEDEPFALSERPEFRAVTTVGSPTERIEALARIQAEVHGRVARLRMVLREAARTDDNLADVERLVLAEEREQARLTLQTVHPDPSDQDIEGMQALYSSDLYILLTEIRGWTPEQYIQWITELSLAVFAAKGVVQ